MLKYNALMLLLMLAATSMHAAYNGYYNPGPGSYNPAFNQNPGPMPAANNFAASAPPVEDDAHVYCTDERQSTLDSNQGICGLVKENKVNVIDETLRRNQALVNVLDEDSKSPLYYAVRNSNVSIARLLLQNGANIHLTYMDNNAELNILQVAVLEDIVSPGMCKLLLSFNRSLADKPLFACSSVYDFVAGKFKNHVSLLDVFSAYPEDSSYNQPRFDSSPSRAYTPPKSRNNRQPSSNNGSWLTRYTVPKTALGSLCLAAVGWFIYHRYTDQHKD